MKRITFPLFLIVILLMVLSLASSAQEKLTHAYEPRDRSLNFTFEYPLDTYSVRDQFINLGTRMGFEPVYGGQVLVEPNDNIVYQETAQTTYRIKILVIPNEEGLVTDDLDSLLGQLQLIQYDSNTLRGLEVTPLTLGEVPAVRVDDVPVGQAGIMTHIIAYYDNLFYEIVVEPVTLGDTDNQDTIETILSTFEIKNLMQ